jgi:hypothetical protein
MQLGTRWTAGEQPPAAVPAALHPAIREVEEASPGDMPGEPKPRWTLTWLEGRPIAELDTGVIVELVSDGEVVVRHDPDDEFG